LLPALGMASLLTATGWAMEAPPPAQGIAEPPRSTADRTVDKIIQSIEKKHDAKVVRKEELVEEGRRILLLRLLSDKGHVRNVKVDVVTGKEL
jgi:hypothetical protein